MRGFSLFIAALIAVASAFPNLPMNTNGRWIIDSNGGNVTFAGVNWEGHIDTMLPEGLQYQSIETIVGRIASLGMNVVRLTWAVEMVDDIYDNNPNQTMKKSLIKVLGQENGTDIFNRIVKNNPQFNESSTRLDAFDAVAREMARQNIWLHLDNQVSKASWCCTFYDGDGWFGAPYFSVANWTRGLSYMASHGKANWPSFVSMSLRNELRPASGSSVQDDYGWPSWYTHMTAGADAIYAANPDLLIYFSGLNSDHDIEDAVTQADLGNGTVFDISKLTYSKKVVFEYHDYGSGNATCDWVFEGLESLGYNAMNTSDPKAKNIAPVITSEMGFGQDNETYMGAYPQCLAKLLTNIQGGFMQWSLAGSLYWKWGQSDVDDTWALLNHDWSDWRSYDSIYNYTQPLVHQLLGLPPNRTIVWQDPGAALSSSLSAASATATTSTSSTTHSTTITHTTFTTAATSPSATGNAAFTAYPADYAGLAVVAVGVAQALL